MSAGGNKRLGGSFFVGVNNIPCWNGRDNGRAVNEAYRGKRNRDNMPAKQNAR